MVSYWRTFLRWLQAQVEYDRKVLIADLAVVSQARIEEEKMLKVTLLDSFVLQHGLRHRVISESNLGKHSGKYPASRHCEFQRYS